MRDWTNAGQKRRYLGKPIWEYRIGSKGGATGSVELSIPTGNYAEDERFARYLVRLKLRCKRLPRGTKFWPSALA